MTVRENRKIEIDGVLMGIYRLAQYLNKEETDLLISKLYKAIEDIRTHKEFLERVEE